MSGTDYDNWTIEKSRMPHQLTKFVKGDTLGRTDARTKLVVSTRSGRVDRRAAPGEATFPLKKHDFRVVVWQ